MGYEFTLGIYLLRAFKGVLKGYIWEPLSGFFFQGRRGAIGGPLKGREEDSFQHFFGIWGFFFTEDRGD